MATKEKTKVKTNTKDDFGLQSTDLRKLILVYWTG